MQVQSYLKEIRNLISEASQIIVLTHKNPTPDGIASLLAFGRILDKLGKEYFLICPDPLPQGLEFFSGSDKISQGIGPRKLIINIKNGKDSVEKVSYFTQEENFNLVITPRNKGIKLDQVEYSFTGLSADLIIVLDTIKPEGLGSFVQEFGPEFSNLPVINIDRHTQNTQFGKINLVDNNYSSTSEIVMLLAEKLEIDFDADLATTLLAGVYGGSRDFRSQTTSKESFKSALNLLEKGANLDFTLKNLYTQESKNEADQKLELSPSLEKGTQDISEVASENPVDSEEQGGEEELEEESISNPPISPSDLQEDFLEDPKIFNSSEKID